MRLPRGRQAQPGVATGQSVLDWRLGCAEVFRGRSPFSTAAEQNKPKDTQTVNIAGKFKFS